VLVFLLILLLIAAMAGVLGAVLKVTLVIVLSLVLAAVAIFYLGAWYLRRRVREFNRSIERQAEDNRRRSTAYDVTSEPQPPRALGDG
jgi:membrane protein implicated in regulation of membrane protease activity